MGRNKDLGAGKGQAVLSSFFAPVSAAAPSVSSSSRAASPTTVVWPSPQASRSLEIERSRKRRCLFGAGAGAGAGDPDLDRNKNAKDSASIPELEASRHQKFLDAFLLQPDKLASERAYYGKPPMGNEKYTPLEQQVVELKAKYPDVLLMVEVGYKFRFFGNDAETASKVLGIIAHYDHSFLTASIPTFRLHVHVRRLVEAGYKVGVVKQTETAAIKAHGLHKAGPFTRDLSALYTKATLEAAQSLAAEGSSVEEGADRLTNYIMCVVEEPIVEEKVGAAKTSRPENFDSRFGVVAVEAATGDIMHGYFMDTITRTELESRLLICAPSELLLTPSLSSVTEKLLLDYAGPASEVRVERVSESSYGSGGAAASIADFYGQDNFYVKREGSANQGLETLMTMPELVVSAFAHVLCYLRQFNLQNVLLLTESFRQFGGQHEMVLSPNTLRQLEILKNNSDGTERGSLLWFMNHTSTSFGARMLRHWLTRPSRDHAVISSRLDAVEEIMEAAKSGHPNENKEDASGAAITRGQQESQGALASVLSSFSKLPDLERGITRIYHKTATTSEFITVIQAIIGTGAQLQRLGACKQGPRAHGSSLLKRLIATATSPSIIEHSNKIVASLDATAAAAGDKLNLFVPGRFSEVDKCRNMVGAVEKDLEELLPNYRQLLKMPNLQYSSVSGVSFLIEVPAAMRVPGDWLKINSTKKVNRYHPPEVLELTDRLSLAKEELSLACTKAWDAFLTEFGLCYVEFRAAVHALAALDCLHSLSVVSLNQGYVRPRFVECQSPCRLRIERGRHPVLDMTLQGAFVPNDTFLSEGGECCQVITGPNMGGKSCYIRQVALIVIMAQMGSYVPAASTTLHVFDAVHTRMGASDSIQNGWSTFFEELSEASAILRNATKRSLVIMDELGRGTSTHDGVAIAYATLHYLLQEVGCFTLFVTHYPKISELVEVFSGKARAYHVSYIADADAASQDADFDAQKVTFLYKLQPGAASRSFGMHVARLAMIPESCIAKAAEMAVKLEKLVAREQLEQKVLLVQEAYLAAELPALKDAQQKVDEASLQESLL